MESEIWRRVDGIFQSAVELSPPARVAFLDSACAGDVELRGEIEALLAADSKEWNFLETPALESAAPFLVDDSPRFEPGEIVAQYEIVKPIGKGGMGEVYLARDRMLSREVALKFVSHDPFSDDQTRQRFHLEARLASTLNHPNILTVHQFGEFNGHQFIATEFVAGESLRERVRRGPMPTAEALAVMMQVVAAVAVAHRTGIVHRDIKPENIMISADGFVKVLDFGIAKAMDRSLSSPPVDGAASEAVAGTLRYMSPEQFNGEEVDARADIFSIGTMFLEMLTGLLPSATIDVAGPSEAVSALNIPPAALRIAWHCMKPDKNDRYVTAEELLADLKTLSAETGSGSADSSRRFFVGNGNDLLATSILASVTLLLGFASIYLLRPQPLSDAVQATLMHMNWTRLPDISFPRGLAEPAVIDGKLYVTGGWTVCTPHADLEMYDPSTGIWVRRTPMPTPRGSHAVGVLNGRIFAVGGDTDCGKSVATVEAYDPETDSWRPRAPLPEPRGGLVVAGVTGKLFAIGGIRNGRFLEHNTVYDPESDKWAARAPMPSQRAGAAAVVINGSIFVFGGRGPVGDEARRVEVYDPENDVWTAKAQMPTRHDYAAATIIDGKVYVVGGHNRGAVDRYDPETDSWSVAGWLERPLIYSRSAELSGSVIIVGGFDGSDYLATVLSFSPPQSPGVVRALCPETDVWRRHAAMPTARTNTGVAAINGIVYVFGGVRDENDQLVFLDTNEAFEPETGKWRRRAPMLTARALRGTNNAVAGGRIHVVGGNPRGICSDAHEVYDPIRDKWSAKAPLPVAKCHVAVIAAGGLIYAIGGNLNGPHSASVEIYDPKSDSWSSGPPMPTARMEVQAGVVGGKIYVLGGANLSGVLDVFEVFDTASGIWSTLPPMPTSRAGAAIAVIDRKLVVSGGYQDTETMLASVAVYDPETAQWSELPPLPSARGYHSAIAVEDTVFSFGGAVLPKFRPVTTVTESIGLRPCRPNHEDPAR